MAEPVPDDVLVLAESTWERIRLDRREGTDARGAQAIIAEAILADRAARPIDVETVERCARAAYSDPHYMVGNFDVDADGIPLPGSPYDRGRYDAAKAIRSLSQRDDTTARSEGTP